MFQIIQALEEGAGFLMSSKSCACLAEIKEHNFLNNLLEDFKHRNAKHWIKFSAAVYQANSVNSVQNDTSGDESDDILPFQIKLYE